MSAPQDRRCPVCDAGRARVEEDVSDEVTVFACAACGTTWAERDDGARRAEVDDAR